MLDRLGGEARRLMSDAEAHARNLGSPQVACPHLLLALVEAGHGGPALDDANVAFADLRGALVATAEENGHTAGRGGRLPYSSALLEVMRSAWRRSVTDKGSTNGATHLLAAMIENRPADVVRLLAGLNVALESLSVERMPSRRRTIPFPQVRGSAAPAEWDDDDDDDIRGDGTGDLGVSRSRHPSARRAVQPLFTALQGGLDLRNRPLAIDLVCPRCDSDIDPVVVDLSVDGRELEALACPACRSLISAWRA